MDGLETATIVLLVFQLVDVDLPRHDIVKAADLGVAKHYDDYAKDYLRSCLREWLLRPLLTILQSTSRSWCKSDDRAFWY